MRSLNKNGFSYVIIKENNACFASMDVMLRNKYNKKAKYALICKTVCRDNSEFIGYIDYSSNLEELQKRANKFPSWYNYCIGLYKELQGNIYHLA